jgi:hypothetical protein
MPYGGTVNLSTIPGSEDANVINGLKVAIAGQLPANPAVNAQGSVTVNSLTYNYKVDSVGNTSVSVTARRRGY